MSDKLIKVGDFVTRLGMGDIHIVTYLSQADEKQCGVTLGTFVCIKQDTGMRHQDDDGAEKLMPPVFSLGSIEDNILRRYTKVKDIYIEELV